jgi:hypothetical protein
MRLSRRHMLGATAALPFISGCALDAGQITISIDNTRGTGRVSSDYMGLGYEISSVAIPGLLSAKNTPYVQLVKNLGHNDIVDGRGVIRIGGNTSDFASYAADGAAVSLPKGTVVTEANLLELRGFLDELRWNLIWGLNLGGDHLDNAVEEARAVDRIFGDRLIALEIGNEPDLFSRAGHRTADYNYDAWLKDYRRYKAAVRTVLPKARFAGPDLAGAAEWMTRFARDEGKDIALLTAHHYIMGQANPAATIETMLAAERKYQGALATFRDAGNAIHKNWRMCETASFSGGGKDGVSNTFAAALWVLDYLFVLAAYGCTGVNMETGVNHLGKISTYTPISDDLNGHYGAAPEYYGLLAFAQVPVGMVFPATLAVEANGINLTAWSVVDINKGERMVAIINKDATQSVDASIQGINIENSDGKPSVAIARGRTLRLTGPALDARDEISLGTARVAADGSWSGAKYEPVQVANGIASLHIPAASAALVWLSA